MRSVGKPLFSFDKQAHYEISTGTAINSISSGVSVNSEDVSVQNENELGILKTSCVSAGSFIPAENKKVIAVDYQRVKKPVKAGTIIVSRMNTPLLVGEVGYVDKSIDNLFLPDRLWEIGVKPEYNARWLANYLVTPKIKFRLKELATGTSGSMKNISQPSFLSIQIFAPSYNEQQKIADFLTAVDSKISQLTEKHRLLNLYKKGAMQQLFSQQLRFKDKGGNAFPEWEEKPLFKVLTEYKCKTTIENQYDVLTSSRNGLMMQSDYYREGRLTERSNVGFHVIPHGYITYRSRSDDRMFFFNLNERGKTGIISHYYPVFSMNNGQNHFFIELTRYHSKIFGKYAVGTSQVVLSYNSFSEIKLKFPCTQEQQKIAEFLQSIDKKITAVAEQIEQTKQFKKGLLQQMFV